VLALNVGCEAQMVSMSLGFFFCGGISVFLFVFWVLFRFLNGVFGSVFVFLAWCSTLLSVTFNVGLCDV